MIAVVIFKPWGTYVSSVQITTCASLAKRMVSGIFRYILMIQCWSFLGIATTSPPRHRWSSRDLAKALFANSVDLNKFRGQEKNAKYRPAKSIVHLGRTDTSQQEEHGTEGMDIDDGFAGSTGESTEEFIPSHALDDLHRQIIDHFTIVLREVADRVRRMSGENFITSTRSIHAASYRKKPLELWSAQNCLEYLDTKAKLKASTPPLSIFLLRRNEDRGWRRGQDWTRKDWMNALDALDDLGRQFRDAVVMNSLAELRRHVFSIFESPMRPTGTWSWRWYRWYMRETRVRGCHRACI